MVGKPRLIFRPGRPDREVFELEPGRATLGRGLDNDIVIPDGSLSRRHAQLEVEAGQVTISDLGSKNGVEVDGVRIESRVLEGGERITCGDAVFRLELSAEVDGLTYVHDIHDDLAHRPIHSLLVDRGEESGNTRLLVTAAEPGDRAQEKLQVLLKVGQILSSPAPLDTILERIADLVLQILDVHRVAILLVDAESGEIEPRVTRTREGDGAGAAGGLYSETIARYVVEQRVAAVFSDVAGDQRFRDAESVLQQDIRTCMCAPLKPKEEVLGVLYVDNLSIAGQFARDELEFLSAFANQAAVAIDNAMLYEKLEHEAVRRNNLERFFPPTVIGTLLEGEGTAGEPIETEVTAVFVDICGFTRMASAMRPIEVVTLLNEYFPALVDVVFDHQGTLEKYIGDALLAVWGAPFRGSEDPDQALRAAVGMQRAIVELNAGWDADRAIQVHVGLATGPVAAGNIGTDAYLQYATIGDTTNLASRICDVAGPGEVLIADSTRRLLSSSDWKLEPLDPVAVKGKEEALQLFRVAWSQ